MMASEKIVVMTPAIQPPPFISIDGLSPDARLVISMISGEYQKKEELAIQRSQINKGYSSYYGSIYRKNFRADLSLIPNAQHADRINQIDDYESQRKASNHCPKPGNSQWDIHLQCAIVANCNDNMTIKQEKKEYSPSLDENVIYHSNPDNQPLVSRLHDFSKYPNHKYENGCDNGANIPSHQYGETIHFLGNRIGDQQHVHSGSGINISNIEYASVKETSDRNSDSFSQDSLIDLLATQTDTEMEKRMNSYYLTEICADIPTSVGNKLLLREKQTIPVKEYNDSEQIQEHESIRTTQKSMQERTIHSYADGVSEFQQICHSTKLPHVSSHQNDKTHDSRCTVKSIQECAQKDKFTLNSAQTVTKTYVDASLFENDDNDVMSVSPALSVDSMVKEPIFIAMSQVTGIAPCSGIHDIVPTDVTQNKIVDTSRNTVDDRCIFNPNNQINSPTHPCTREPLNMDMHTNTNTFITHNISYTEIQLISNNGGVNIHAPIVSSHSDNPSKYSAAFTEEITLTNKEVRTSNLYRNHDNIENVIDTDTCQREVAGPSVARIGDISAQPMDNIVTITEKACSRCIDLVLSKEVCEGEHSVEVLNIPLPAKATGLTHSIFRNIENNDCCIEQGASAKLPVSALSGPAPALLSNQKGGKKRSGNGIQSKMQNGKATRRDLPVWPISTANSHGSQEDQSLQEIENILDGVPQLKKQKIKHGRTNSQFQAPFKKQVCGQSRCLDKDREKSTAVNSSKETNVKQLLPDGPVTMINHTKRNVPEQDSIMDLSDSSRMTFLAKALNADELLLALVNNDGSCNLTKPSKSTVVLKAVSKIAVGITSYDAKEKDCNNPRFLPQIVEQQTIDMFMLPLFNVKDDQMNEWVRDVLGQILMCPAKKICFQAQDLMYCLLKLFKFPENDVALHWIIQDPSIAAWLLEPDIPATTFSDLTKEHSIITQSTLTSSMKKLSSTMLQLSEKLKVRDLWPLFLYVETRLIPLLALMEHRCIHIDTKMLSEFSSVLKKKLDQLEKKARDAVGHSFLMTSHPQLRQVLFEELKLDQKLPSHSRLGKTAVTQMKSTSEAVLTQLVPLHPLPAIILEHRQLQKLKSTYVDGIISSVATGKDVLYTHWDQTAAATGRLTSYQPNVQSIPKLSITVRDFEKNYIVEKDVKSECEIFARDPFLSREGCSFLTADFQQIELRLLAHLSDDGKLIKIFNNANTEDIFMELTSEWLGKPINMVTVNEREQTKRVVYSVMYGAGKEKLAEYLKISPLNAHAIMTSFLLKFPAVNSFTKKCIEFCRNNGYTCTIFNRRRLFKNIKHSSSNLRAQAERQAVNFSVQGSAADLCKAAMLQVNQALIDQPHLRARRSVSSCPRVFSTNVTEESFLAKPYPFLAKLRPLYAHLRINFNTLKPEFGESQFKAILQIHDELLFEAPDENIASVRDIVTSVMESTAGLCGSMVKLKVPLKVSISTGKRWGHLAPDTHR